MNHSLWSPSVVRFDNNNAGGRWGHIFPSTENAAVTSVPFDAPCFQLQEFSSQSKLSLTPTLLPAAMRCYRLCNNKCLSASNRRRESCQEPARPGSEQEWKKGCQALQSCCRLPGAGEGAAPERQRERPGASPSAAAPAPAASSELLTPLRDLSVALFLETRLPPASISSQRRLDSTKWN